MAMDEHGTVVTCLVTDCSYNKGEECEAPGIEVGDNHPECDTYTQDAVNPIQPGMSHVQKCQVEQCTFNMGMQCDAPGITVNYHSDHADCETYRPKSGMGGMGSGQSGMQF